MPDQKWQTLYREALRESDPQAIKRQIDIARCAINIRLDDLEDSQDSREKQQLNNALYAAANIVDAKTSRVIKTVTLVRQFLR